MRLGFILPLLVTAVLIAFLATGIGRALDQRWNEIQRNAACLETGRPADCEQIAP